MSAHHTRRKVLTGLAVAPLAGVAASLPALATTDVHAAAARHKAAWQAFEDNCWRSDEMDPRYVPADAEKNEAIWDAYNEAEYATFDQFMEVRPQTPEDMRAKASYLLSRMRGGDITHENWEAFLGAML